MGIRETMENNKDIAGLGVVGAVAAYVVSDWQQVVQIVSTAFLVAAASCLGGYITKKILASMEGLVTSWWENRKIKVTTSNKKELDEKSESSVD